MLVDDSEELFEAALLLKDVCSEVHAHADSGQPAQRASLIIHSRFAHDMRSVHKKIFEI